jgi:glycosyltransferase involved in cell wall biosynthesis
MKNILILANYLPNEGWGGGVIIRSLTDNYPENIRLYWSTFNMAYHSNRKTCNGIELLEFRTRYFRGRNFSGLILKLETLQFIRDFKKLVQKNSLDKIWIILGTSYEHLYRINALVKQLDIPVHVTVHDDPVLEIHDAKKQKANQLFKEILQKASSIDVISSRMQSKYKADFNVDAIVITRCIPDDFPKSTNKSNEIIRIIMAGFGNAPSPWPEPLIESIDLLNKKRNCRLHLFDPKLKKYQSNFVDVRELMDEKKFNSFLKDMDLGYACDDMSPGNIKFAQMSLPTKIITYIGAGIPFVYHGPQDSTVGDLLQQYETGIIVENNNPEEIAKAFLTIVDNYPFYSKNCKLANEKLFSSNVVKDVFFTRLLKDI